MKPVAFPTGVLEEFRWRPTGGILLFVGLALAAPKQNPLLQADDCLHCVEDIVNAVAQCEVRTLLFPSEFLKNS